jgi:oligopeptide/dipeptide ABC transporter ATP-binding protein
VKLTPMSSRHSRAHVIGSTAPPEGGATLLSVDRLSMRFPLPRRRFVQACDDVSFSISPGETLGLIGESGSGKSTVGRCIVRLNEPTGGVVSYNGSDVNSLSKAQFRRFRSRVQMVFQDSSDSLDPRLPVRKSLDESLRLFGESSRQQRKGRIVELLDQVGFAAKNQESLPGELSAGDQQRASIARALAHNPAMIVLDEPTSSLPPNAEAQIIHLLQELQTTLGLAYLFISHDLSLVEHFCHRVAVMYLSQIVEIGPKEQVLRHPRHPYSRALLASVLSLTPETRRIDSPPRFQLHGEIPSPVDLPSACYLVGRCPIEEDRCSDSLQSLLPVTPDVSVRCWKAGGVHE